MTRRKSSADTTMSAQEQLKATRFRLPSTLSVQLRELEISPAAVLRRAGLPARFLEQSKIWMTTEERFAFYQAVAEVSGDPTIGLKLGSEKRVERYNPISIIALYSRSFRDAIERMARYKRLTGPQELSLEQHGDECRVEFHWLLTDQEVPSTQVDTCFAWMLTIGQRGTGRELRPYRVELARPESHREEYEKHFVCPVLFDRPRDLLVFLSEDLDRPFQTYNPDLLELVAPQLDRELSRQLEDSTLANQVKGTIKTLAAGKRPRLENLAAELRLSPRTLQRRLLEEGLSFHKLLEDARRELAQHYLTHSDLELNEVAHLIGYEDPNSFFRAFQKWEGTSPGEWRSSAMARN